MVLKLHCLLMNSWNHMSHSAHMMLWVDWRQKWSSVGRDFNYSFYISLCAAITSCSCSCYYCYYDYFYLVGAISITYSSYSSVWIFFQLLFHRVTLYFCVTLFWFYSSVESYSSPVCQHAQTPGLPLFCCIIRPKVSYSTNSSKKIRFRRVPVLGGSETGLFWMNFTNQWNVETWKWAKC